MHETHYLSREQNIKYLDLAENDADKINFIALKSIKSDP